MTGCSEPEGPSAVPCPRRRELRFACPDRKVLCLTGDGSALYTVQALWTQAREQLDVVTVVYANRTYAILHTELLNVGATPGPKAHDMFDLDRPEINWVEMVALHGRRGPPGRYCRGVQRGVGRRICHIGPVSDRSQDLTGDARLASRIDPEAMPRLTFQAAVILAEWKVRRRTSPDVTCLER